MQINDMTDILGLIDVQPTFMPGGELCVTDGNAIVAPINALTAKFYHVFVTQDWHPPNHTSFAISYQDAQPYDVLNMSYGKQILWPAHAIAGTESAAIHPDIDQTKVEVVIRKGFRRELDSYSAFFENDRATATGLEGWLRQRGFSRLFLCGLATDFCVAWSAEDAARLGFTVFIIEDACRGIALPVGNGRTTMDEARERLTVAGVRFITSADILNNRDTVV